ncbi:MAG: PKD domain-containing protein [Pirellulales bacterium]|nr:PKD domain-containing protein [Pirellulales bacterium]
MFLIGCLFMGLFTLLARCRVPIGRGRHALQLEAAPLAPRRLERRRVLDASVAQLFLGSLPESGPFVQTGEFTNHQADPSPPLAVTSTATSTSTSLVIPNSPPIISGIYTFPDSTDKNDAPVDVLILFGDLDAQDTHMIDIDWGDGSPVESITVDFQKRFLFTPHQYLNDNPTGTPVDTHDIQVTVRDQRGGMAMGSAPVTVSNVAPKIDAIFITSPVDEDGVAFLEMSFTNPGSLDMHTVEIDWGDGTPTETITLAVGERTLDASHRYLNDEPTGTFSDTYQVTLKLVDDDAGMDSAMLAVTVNNVAPSNIQIAPVAMIDENGTAQLQLTFADPGTLDSHWIDIDWGDGTSVETISLIPGARSLAATHQYLDDNPTGTLTDTYQVAVTVTDDDTGMSMVTAPIVVNNVMPTITIDGEPATSSEGTAISLASTVVDPGSLDTFAYAWVVSAGGNIVATGSGPTFSFTPADNGGHEVTLTVTDDDGGIGSKMVSINVLNVDPTLGAIADIVTDEGTFISLPPATFTDPGFDLVAAGTEENFTGTIDWGDGTTEPLADITLTEVPGSEGVNVDPTLGAIADIVTDEGTFISLPPATFTDPGFDLVAAGTEENFTGTIDWGDGTTEPLADITLTEVPGSEGVLTTGTISAMHAYADDGVYTATVTVMDDDGGTASQSFGVTVNNVVPVLTGEDASLNLDEGDQFTLFDLGIGLSDPGFDNGLNPIPGGELEEIFVGVSIDWGDGSAAIPVNVVDRVSGSEGVPTTAMFEHAVHAYADNGIYLVTIEFSDDDGGFTTGTFEIVVHNVAPSLTLTDRALEINEGETLVLADLGVFSDPGYNNPLNPNLPPAGSLESFSYDVDWGDGTPVETGVLPATGTDGSQGVLTTGTLADSHFYADNDPDNLFTITVSLYDDDGGSTQQTIVVTVLNVNPTLDPIVATDVGSEGKTTLDLTFSDPGADVFEIMVDWGDKLSLAPEDRFVVETVHVGPTPTSYTLVHWYSGPPDPTSPAADIVITVKILDDDFGTAGVSDIGLSNLELVAISNAGIGATPIRIDTTPQVPRLVFPRRAESTILLNTSTSGQGSVQGADLRSASGETKATNERFLELQVISATGEYGERIRLKPEVLKDLPGLFRRLADNHYAIFLVRTETNTRRLVFDFFVRNGRAIDPGDDSEGTRDRPPTDEAAEQVAPEAAPVVPGGEADLNEDQDEPAVGPLVSPPGDAADLGAISRGPPHAPWPAIQARSQGWTVAATALVASRACRDWAQRVDRAVAAAGARRWRRLRSHPHLPYKRKNP